MNIPVLILVYYAAVQETESAEYRSFQRHFADLFECIQNPTILSGGCDPKLLSGLLYSPLLLIPATGFVPLGQFQASVVRFSQDEKWSLDDANRFRNRIGFYFHDDRGGLIHVEIRKFVSHLDVRILTDAVINPRLILECRQLWTMFCEVGALIPHTRDVHWDFGFYCPHTVQSGQRPHPARCLSKTKPQHVICTRQDCRGGPVGLEYKHKCWFTVSACVLFSIVVYMVCVCTGGY